MSKIITYNVNGIRAALQKNWIEWLKSENPDVICLQEIKAQTDQIPLEIFEDAGYHHYWYPAQKKGYSGVAILSKTKPDKVVYGMDLPLYDQEGRFIRADFGQLSVCSVYMPSGTTGDERQAFKMKWLDDFTEYVNRLKKDRKNLVISGDYNICNKAIDIHNPVTNAQSSGFLPEERAWFDSFLEQGFIDSFRVINQEPHQYTWWSFRANSRAKNLGWRIDYNLLSKELKSQVKFARIMPEAVHSDHCPCSVELNIEI